MVGLDEICIALAFDLSFTIAPHLYLSDTLAISKAYISDYTFSSAPQCPPLRYCE